MEEGYLVFLDPMPLVEYGMSFYDGQPRDDHGRFSNGSMALSVLRFRANNVPATFRSSKKYDEIQSMLKERHAIRGKWHHDQVGNFIVSKAGLRHAVRTFPSRVKNIALWNLDNIIEKIDNFNEEKPHNGKKGVNKEIVGSVIASIGRHAYRVTVFIEQASDGINRFHHVRIDKEKAPRQMPEG